MDCEEFELYKAKMYRLDSGKVVQFYDEKGAHWGHVERFNANKMVDGFPQIIVSCDHLLYGLSIREIFIED